MRIRFVVTAVATIILATLAAACGGRAGQPSTTAPTIGTSPIESPAAKASPGGVTDSAATGKIAFLSSSGRLSEIFVVNADGSGMSNLTNDPAQDGDPAVGEFGGFTWSPDGSRIVFASDRDGSSELYVMNADGSAVTRLTDDPAFDGKPRWSPDGTSIAFRSDRDGNRDIYIVRVDGSALTRITDDPGVHNTDHVWSPDSSRIAFMRFDAVADNELYVIGADGSNLTLLSDEATFGPVWSPDGSAIAFEVVQSFNTDIAVVNADGTGQFDLTGDSTFGSDPAWSPDGSRIAFASARDGNFEIYSTNADGSDVRQLTNSDTAFNADPAWSPDGSSIAFACAPEFGASEVCVMNADGTGLTMLTNDPDEHKTAPAWQPAP